MTSAVPNAAPSHQAVPVAREPLLEQQEHCVIGGDAQTGDTVAPGGSSGSGSFPWLPAAGFAYLSFSSGMALHSSWPDRGAVAFIVFAYLDLVLLFYCLRRYERAEPGSALRDRLKVAVWLLTAALVVLFSHKVASVMPAAAAALVWVMGLATITGGFVAFFCLKKT
ncbi:hypothetical protein BAE44_0022515 [Dichanthelium oligosanthes]|uniref:Uncharacterized protein n=1 Tax=Dichanthelium oligosanthes TaxID=888268 RepID=A0A1E5UUA2_9POAL|nr:hypothetical protein BAE44_0022515 [Dichanthelium oligosanthes]